MSPDGTRLFVVDLDDAATYGGVTVVDTMTRKVVKVIQLGDASDGIAISPDDSAVYVTQWNLHQIVKSTITYKVLTSIPEHCTCNPKKKGPRIRTEPDCLLLSSVAFGERTWSRSYRIGHFLCDLPISRSTGIGSDPRIALKGSELQLRLTP